MKLLQTLAAAMLASLCTACGTTAPSRFFALTSLEPEAAQGQALAAAAWIESVHIAQYLQRPQMVRRTSAVEIEVDEYNRWAEPLDLALARVLEGDLRVLLGAQAATGTRASCTVTRFERDAQGRAVLEASYTLRSSDPARTPLSRSWIARTELASPGDAAELAAALDGLVHDLARALAADLAG